MSKKLFVFVFAAVLCVAPVITLGATVKTGENYYLDSNQTINDNLYAAAGTVGVAGTVNGDVMAAGGSINVTGPVSGDIEAAGGNINITSDVAGDIRVAGGNITISKSAGGDLIVAGGQVNVTSDFSAGKDVKIMGGNVNFTGKAKGNLEIKAGTVYVNGSVAGNLDVTAQDIKLGPKAAIAGNFTYSSSRNATLEQGAVVEGETKFNKINLPQRGQIATVSKGVLAGLFGVAWAIKTLAVIIVGLILIYAFKSPTKSVLEMAAVNFWKNVLVGLIVLVVMPIAIILSFITLVGALAGVIALVFYIVLILLASVFGILVFAKLCLKYLFKKPDYEINWWILILSVLVFGIVGIIPFVGWIFVFVIFLSAMGSVSGVVYSKLRA